jgi:hypothetical protein
VPPYPWYDEVVSATPLTQGDIVEDCPVLTFRADTWNPPPGRTLVDALTAAGGYARVRAVVMTQACDLDQRKVRDAVLCPLDSIDSFRAEWDAARSTQGQEHGNKAWRSKFEELRQGRIWSQALLERHADVAGATKMPQQVVQFSKVYSLPVDFLQSWVITEAAPRVRLLPPYREHLSQAFARFFMRVGLPQDILAL